MSAAAVLARRRRARGRHRPAAHTAGRSALREPQFRRYLAGQATSELGDQVWSVAMSWSAVRLGSPGAAGVVMMLASLPRLALLLGGGVIADRVDIRRLMLGSDAAQTVITLAAAGVALVARPGLGLLVVMTLIYGAVSGVFMPADRAMQPRLLAPDQYGSGQVASSLLARAALALGAPLGGVAVALGGLPLALAVNGLTFAVSVATLAGVHPRPLARTVTPASTARGYASDFFEGLRFLTRHSVLRPVTAINFVANLGFVGPMNIGIAELASRRGWGAGGIGLLLTGFGAGACAAAVLQLRWRVRARAGWWIAGLYGLAGLALGSLAVAPTLAVAVAGTAAVGLAGGPAAVACSVLTQQHTPDPLRGRVAAFTLLSGYGTVPLAMAGTGIAIAAAGTSVTFAVCGAIEASVGLWLLTPGFRRAEISS